MPALGMKLRSSQLARLLILLALFAAGALLECRQWTALDDANVWWRIRTGEWILHTHTLPHQALFSRAAELPWTASAWGTNVLISLGFAVAGIRALPLFAIIARMALAVVLFLLAGGRRDKRWLPAGILALLALWIAGAASCDPAAVSIVLYGVELLLLLRVQRTGDLRALYAIPVLFFFWANLGPEFPWGLLLLLIFVAAEAVAQWVPALQSGGRIPMQKLLAVSAASVILPCVAPYSFHLYANFFDELYSAPLLKYLPEMHALGFRQPRDFVLALLVLGVFFVLGRRRNLFLILALVVMVPFAFRFQRDTWLALLPAVAAFAMLWPHEAEEPRASCGELGVAAAISGIAVIAIVAATLSPAQLQERVAGKFPVRAAEYIQEHKLSGPLFELSGWGGYVIFALPDYPAAMDSRVAAYGAAAYEQEKQLSTGEAPLDSVPAFMESRTLLLPADAPMAQALIRIPQLRERYKAVYQDSVAIVFAVQ